MDSDEFSTLFRDRGYYLDNPSESSNDDGNEEWFTAMERLRDNDPRLNKLEGGFENTYPRHMTDREWEELGHDISRSGYLECVILSDGALNDRRMECLFRGLTSCPSALGELCFPENEISVVGVQRMVPFLQQKSNSLIEINLNCNNIKSRGFNVLLRALRGSDISRLECAKCGIKSIEIDTKHIPRYLQFLRLDENNINTDGCRGLATLLKEEDSALEHLNLAKNKIDDDGVEVLTDALQNNTSLKTLNVGQNGGITRRGRVMLLKLVNDVSSIKATLQSNHTLQSIGDIRSGGLSDNMFMFRSNISLALRINSTCKLNPEAAGKEKMIRTQFHSANRAELCWLQDVDRSVYNEINALHLPELLALIGRRHGKGELHLALSSSIIALFSTVNRKKCIQQKRAYHASKAAEHTAKVVELDAELAEIEGAAAGNTVTVDDIDQRSNKRRRKWWWGLWGGAS